MLLLSLTISYFPSLYGNEICLNLSPELKCFISILLLSLKLFKRSVTIRREICPIRAEISTHKHGEKLYISYLYD